MGERGNRADQAVLSIRQAGWSGAGDCVLHVRDDAVWLQRLTVYLKSWG